MKRRRSFGRGRRKQRVGWVTDVFDASIDVETAPPKVMTQMSILEYDDVHSDTTLIAHPLVCKRAIVSGLLSLQSLVAGAGQTTQAPVFGVGMFIMDVDDLVDADFSDPSFGTLLHSQRVLQVKVCGATVMASSSFSTSYATAGYDGEGLRIDMDWKGVAKLKPDERLWVGVQMLWPSGDLSDNLIVRARFISRCLILR